jgi:radical SAM superfamily enzyme YgiQ (UPF0313 family)
VLLCLVFYMCGKTLTPTSQYIDKYVSIKLPVSKFNKMDKHKTWCILYNFKGRTLESYWPFKYLTQTNKRAVHIKFSSRHSESTESTGRR